MIRNNKQSAFTIVELLVVIVVIGILATILMISYSGISKRAIEDTLKADLTNAARQLESDAINDYVYPTSVASANGGKGLSKSPDTIFQYSATSDTYCLDAMSASNNSIFFHINSDSGTILDDNCASD